MLGSCFRMLAVILASLRLNCISSKCLNETCNYHRVHQRTAAVPRLQSRLDMCRIRSGSVLVTASYGRYGQRAARIGPDRICQIRLSHPFQPRVPKKAWVTYCVKPTRRIRSGLVRVWANASGLVNQAGVQESSGPVSGRTQPACYQFSTL